MRLIVEKYRYVLILVFFCSIQFAVFQTHGIRIVNDSNRYMEYSHAIAYGDFYQEHNIWYFGFCGFMAVFFKLGLGIKSIILAQVLISACSVLLLQKAMEKLSGNVLASLVTCLAYLCFIEVSSWNFYILTESLFVSSICAFVYFLTHYTFSKHKFDLILTSLFALIVFWLRPIGISLVVAFALYLYVALLHNLLKNWQKIFLALTFSLAFLVLLTFMLSSFHLVENYATGEIVFGISRIPNYHGHEQILMEIPKDLYVPTQGSTLYKAIDFYVKNPVFGLKLLFLKAFYFLSHYKPYYSFWHNVHTLFLLIPAYIGTILFLKSANYLALKTFVLSYIVFSTLIIMLTCEDWDGRFLMGLIPILSYASVLAIDRILRKD
jgi:hypothetical protein